MKPELLCPAGSPEALRFAVQSGADAVYLGCGDFNARRSAQNFSPEDLAPSVRYCHERGVRVYLTLNTLLTDRELPQALSLAREACRAGVDAVLVQDWGLLALLGAALPDLPLHASTQMSIFTPGGAAAVAEDGCRRVVLARECSASQTAALCRQGAAEVEVFAHGALCMCYSGQCAMSALLGGRSGNRGRCAQPCRLPYTLLAEGLPPARGNAPGYPLSLKDNCLSGDLAAMEDMGVACLKIEGRMKRPEYVAVVGGIYRRLLDEGRGPTAEEQRQLEAAFSRSGFTRGYWAGRPGRDMFGTRPQGAAEPEELFARVRAACQGDALRQVEVDFSCRIAPGEAASLTARDGAGHCVQVLGPVPQAARTRPLTEEEVAARLKKTGGTAYVCRRAEAEVAPGLALPASALNALRRSALEALGQARCALPPRRELPPPPAPEDRFAAPAPAYTVSARSMEQIARLPRQLSPARVYLPLEELCRDGETLPEGPEWCALLPRVWREEDEAALRRMLRQAQGRGVTAVLAGNIGHTALVKDMDFTLYGDYGLNVFNGRALAYLAKKGFSSACLSFELRFSQIRDLPKALPAEAIVYGRLPLMITENCLLHCGGLCGKKGTDPLLPSAAPCSRPSALKDRTGAAFPLLFQWGHRTEIQNSLPLWLADQAAWRSLGLAFARLRFTTESAQEAEAVCRGYLARQAAPGPFTRGLYHRGVE